MRHEQTALWDSDESAARKLEGPIVAQAIHMFLPARLSLSAYPLGGLIFYCKSPHTRTH
ncbi:unnamed protein product [Periconia digitata]|uniref:Uncharacterized protein n=1 Tax=Periconia digitata TaxID=1303443 RepID=A0A9W4XH67_9PLEO|nr:unnamed protein product [Periconia digitata]